VHTLIDDHTGRPIPKNAKYLHIQVRPQNPGRDRMNVYQDVRSVTAVVNAVRAALVKAQLAHEPAPTIEISERTHF
jgi:hypothetical protein